MKAIFLESNPETGQAELDNQFNEIFPEGFKAHLETQQASADKFEHDIIDPLIKLFDGIDLSTGNVSKHIIDDLNGALHHEDNGSALCQALDQFRKAFTALAQRIYFRLMMIPDVFLVLILQYFFWGGCRGISDTRAGRPLSKTYVEQKQQSCQSMLPTAKLSAV